MMILAVLFITTTIVIALERPDLYFDKTTKKYSLVYSDNTYCPIKDSYTLSTLGYDKDNSVIIKNINENYKLSNKFDCPITLISYQKQKNNKCDLIYLLSYDLTNILTNNVSYIENIRNIGELFNPSILPNGEDFLLIRRQDNMKGHNNTLEIINNKFNHIVPLKYNYKEPLSIYETDIRLFRKPDGNILLIISNYVKWYYVYTAVRDLKYDKSSKTYTLSDQILLEYDGIKGRDEDKWRSKNWMAFVYNNEIYFIIRMFPLTIVKYPDDNKIHKTTFNGVIHKSSYVYLIDDEVNKCGNGLDYTLPLNIWEFHDIRGSTPLTLVPAVGYLGFFHSKYSYCHNNGSYIQYYFGAFLMSSTKPFRITKMTTYPIQAKELVFNPRFSPSRQSVIFPMSFYLTDENNNILDSLNVQTTPSKIILQAGYNDKYGLLLTLDFSLLISSMSDIKC